MPVQQRVLTIEKHHIHFDKFFKLKDYIKIGKMSHDKKLKIQSAL